MFLSRQHRKFQKLLRWRLRPHENRPRFLLWPIRIWWLELPQLRYGRAEEPLQVSIVLAHGCRPLKLLLYSTNRKIRRHVNYSLATSVIKEVPFVL